MQAVLDSTMGPHILECVSMSPGIMVRECSGTGSLEVITWGDPKNLIIGISTYLEGWTHLWAMIRGLEGVLVPQSLS